MPFDLHRTVDDVYEASHEVEYSTTRVKEKQPVEIWETNATPSRPTRRWIQIDEKHISRRLHRFQVYFARDEFLRESAENCAITRMQNERGAQL